MSSVSTDRRDVSVRRPGTALLVSRCAWTLYNFRAGQMVALRDAGWTVVGGGSGGDGFEPRIEALGFPFVTLPVDRRGINPVADLRLLFTLYRWYRSVQPEVVHHFTIKPVIYGSLAARMAGVPRILNTITGLGHVFIEEDIRWLRRLVSMQYRLSLSCAHRTFFLNADDMRLFLDERLVSPHKALLLPGSGVDTRHFVPECAPADQPPVCLMVARLLREKGVYEFVEAARRIRAERPDVRFHLLGRRDERNPSVVPAEDLDRWRQEGVVEWLGEAEDVRPFIARSQIVVLPSYREGLPKSLLEAGAMGKPVIAADVVGCRDVVRSGINGLLVPPRDPAALAAAVERLLGDPEARERMGREGRQRVEKEFDESIVLRTVLAMYDARRL